MSALFPKWSNTVALLAIATLVLIPTFAVAGLLLYQRTPFATGQFNPVEQPIEFDHRHHSGDEGIDCRYCHQTVEVAATAGIPSTQVCMNCHSQVWNKSPLLASVRQSYFTGQPLVWNRVHDLPDFVYFNHAIHVNKGVGCVTCHGRVDQMAAVEQVAPLTMGWCLDCHRNPTPHLRPVDQITQMEVQPGGGINVPDVHARTQCTTCHR